MATKRARLKYALRHVGWPNVIGLVAALLTAVLPTLPQEGTTPWLTILRWAAGLTFVFWLLAVANRYGEADARLADENAKVGLTKLVRLRSDGQKLLDGPVYVYPKDGGLTEEQIKDFNTGWIIECGKWRLSGLTVAREFLSEEARLHLENPPYIEISPFEYVRRHTTDERVRKQRQVLTNTLGAMLDIVNHPASYAATTATLRSPPPSTGDQSGQ